MPRDALGLLGILRKSWTSLQTETSFHARSRGQPRGNETETGFFFLRGGDVMACISDGRAD